jgi:uncharacterized protein YyaL (SSP411 family)
MEDIMITETRYDTVHDSTLTKWNGLTINELMEEKTVLQRKLELLTNESHGTRKELNRILTHLSNFIDKRIVIEEHSKEY